MKPLIRVAIFAATLIFILSGKMGVAKVESIKLDQISDMMDSVYKIECTSEGSYSQGSGFIIDHVLISNEHVIGEAEECSVNDQIVNIRENQVFANKNYDIMGIRMEGRSLKYTTAFPLIGEQVYTMGFPKNKFRMTEGSVKFIVQKYGMKIIISDAYVAPGSSGGILFNNYGEVVGITTRKVKDFVEVIPMMYVHQELNKAKEG